jgi:hypothetical protein
MLIVIIGGAVFYTAVMVAWTKFNYDETKNNNRRTERILDAEDRKENTFRKIRQINVRTTSGKIYEYPGVVAYARDGDEWQIINEESKLVAVFERREVEGLEFVREDAATYNEVLK